MVKPIEQQDLIFLLARRAQGRYSWGRNPFRVTNSSRFSDGWDDYIENRVFTWNEDLSTIELGVKRYLPNAQDELRELQHSFARLNEALGAFHRAGGEPHADQRRKATAALETVEDDIQALQEELARYLD